MPTRRSFLASLTEYSALAVAGFATAGSVATAGCLGQIRLPVSGVLTYKSVQVGWQYEGQMHRAELCWVWSDGESRIFGWYPEEYPDAVPSAAEVVVTDELERRLERDFDRVEYRLGFTRPNGTGGELRSTDWFVALASRREFDSVQFGDAAEVGFGDSRVSVYHVERGAVGPVDDWDQSVRPMDFSERFAYAGVPID